MSSFVSFVSFVFTVLLSAAAVMPNTVGAAQTCLSPGLWYTIVDSTPKAVSAQQILADMARRRVVLLGENHEDADHHRWQLQTLAALLVLQPNMVIGFEAFPRRTQPVL